MNNFKSPLDGMDITKQILYAIIWIAVSTKKRSFNVYIDSKSVKIIQQNTEKIYI